MRHFDIKSVCQKPVSKSLPCTALTRMGLPVASGTACVSRGHRLPPRVRSGCGAGREVAVPGLRAWRPEPCVVVPRAPGCSRLRAVFQDTSHGTAALRALVLSGSSPESVRLLRTPVSAGPAFVANSDAPPRRPPGACPLLPPLACCSLWLWYAVLRLRDFGGIHVSSRWRARASACGLPRQPCDLGETACSLCASHCACGMQLRACVRTEGGSSGWSSGRHPESPRSVLFSLSTW